MKVKDWDIKRHIKDDFYLVEAPDPWGEVVLHKKKIQEHLGVDEKELEEILAQVQ